MLRIKAWWPLVFSGVLCSCSGDRFVESSDLEVSRVLIDGTPGEVAPAPNGEYDFGTVITRGQVLAHDFSLKNSTADRIDLLELIAETPCCSYMGEVKPSIMPGERVSIPTRLKTGVRVGPTVVEFKVRTSSEKNPLQRFRLKANFVEEVKIELDDSSDTKIFMGKAGNQALLVKTRFLGGNEGKRVVSVSSDSKLIALLIPEQKTLKREDNIEEIVQKIALELPPSQRIGDHREELTIKWADGATKKRLISWETIPCLKISPRNLSIQHTDSSQAVKVIVKSMDGAFRIRDIKGPIIRDSLNLGQSSSLVHSFELEIITKMKPHIYFEQIEFVTDHPNQPTVSVNLMVSPRGSDTNSAKAVVE